MPQSWVPQYRLNPCGKENLRRINELAMIQIFTTISRGLDYPQLWFLRDRLWRRPGSIITGNIFHLRFLS
jgi:hypothetical protein